MNPLHHHPSASRNPYFPQHDHQPPQRHHGYQPQAHQPTAFGELEDPSTPHTSASSNLSPENQINASPVRTKRKGATPPAPAWSVKASKMTQSTSPVASKARRVRTGCLTCRKRHLKCDEGTPDCGNCMKGNRTCERGLRLNFLDIQVKDPPFLVPQTRDWVVNFQDESRQIASEYRGGLKRYTSVSDLHRRVSTERRFDSSRRSQSAVRRPAQEQPTAFFTGSSLISNSANGLSNINNTNTNNPEPQEGSYPASVGQPPPLLPSPPPPMHNSISYDNGQLSLHNLLSHRHNETFINAPIVTSAPPSAFALTALQQPFTIKEEPTCYSVNRSRRSSESSSVTSSLIPDGTTVNAHHPPNSNHLSVDRLNPIQASPDGLTTPSTDKSGSERDYLSTEDEIRFMQVFIDEVTIWMDTLNKDQHFANTLPYLALKSPMILNACLACGAKRLSPTDGKGGVYYDTATTQMMRSLQNPDRDTEETAITAVVLNVYETMMDTPTQRLHHISGARALIRECGWDAASAGIAAACFWLNIGLEVLTCLAQNWKTAWDPDDWGMDLEFTTWIVGSHSGSVVGSETHEASKALDSLQAHEEVWTQRIFYIMAKVVNFRATIPRFQEPSPHDEQVRLQSRFAEWNRLKALLDAWNHNCPRSMQSFGYSLERSSRSVFPNIWLLKRPSTTSRIMYQTAMTLLPQLNPLPSTSHPSSSSSHSHPHPHFPDESLSLSRHHARQVCGMVAHTSDRAILSISIRCLIIAGSVLDAKPERDEVLALLERINRETGWKLDKAREELLTAWEGPTSKGFGAAATAGGINGARAGEGGGGGAAGGIKLLVAPVPTRPPMVNPLLANADFRLENHPYKNWWVLPNNMKEQGKEEEEQEEEGQEAGYRGHQRDQNGEGGGRKQFREETGRFVWDEAGGY
ncbi:hypothetical protein QBC42DRAFT_90542 [Cladorrhinum samala]|uniref:Zn(2)-C6 fungal-type domain-containing protein n=1 Tax=Cladorrhinum samala TaxID=585594 RepID=A0AAV9HZM9_9PEZI|nr:hypothetical protein QBC42DRAFT_90542 [Cladorrhinum samala]